MVAQTYRKKPVEIEAMQFDGSAYSAMHIGQWTGGLAIYDGISLQIPTLEGPMLAAKGDWVIKGVAGEFYPCKPAIFAATYEKV